MPDRSTTRTTVEISCERSMIRMMRRPSFWARSAV